MVMSHKISTLRRSATSKFLKPLLRFLSSGISSKNYKKQAQAADAEVRRQNSANEALEAALEAALARCHAAPDRDVALCTALPPLRPQPAQEQRFHPRYVLQHNDDDELLF